MLHLYDAFNTLKNRFALYVLKSASVHLYMYIQYINRIQKQPDSRNNTKTGAIQKYKEKNFFKTHVQPLELEFPFLQCSITLSKKLNISGKTTFFQKFVLKIILRRLEYIICVYIFPFLTGLILKSAMICFQLVIGAHDHRDYFSHKRRNYK